MTDEPIVDPDADPDVKNDPVPEPAQPEPAEPEDDGSTTEPED